MSRALQDRLCFGAAACGSYEMASRLAAKWGVEVDDSTIHALVSKVGTRARELTQARADRALDPATRPQVVREAGGEIGDAPFSLVLMVDGWMARERGGGWGLKLEGGERVNWREIKTAIVFRVEDRSASASGRPMLIGKYCVAWQGDPHELGRRLHGEALRRGLAQARQVFVVADGGVWIWKIFEDRFSQATGVLDFYHAAQHLWAVAHEIHGQGSKEAREWVEPLLHQLKNGGEAGVVNTLEDLASVCADVSESVAQCGANHTSPGASACANASASATQCVRRELNYFKEHREHIHYSEAKARGCPQGSGAMESTCAQLQTRLKRPGQFWSESGLLNLLEIELYRRNEEWEMLWPIPT